MIAYRLYEANTSYVCSGEIHMACKSTCFLPTSQFVAASMTAVLLSGASALGQSGGPPAAIVDCATESLQAAVDDASGGVRQSRKEILFEGTCAEQIEIRADDLVLDGDPGDDGTADGTIQGTVSVIGADSVALRNFDVEDDGVARPLDFGIRVVDDADASIENVSLLRSGESSAGFVVGIIAQRNSLIRVSDSSIGIEDDFPAQDFEPQQDFIPLPRACNAVAVNANTNSLVQSLGANEFTAENDAAICATNDSSYRQESSRDVIDAPVPAAAWADSMTDIRGADLNISSAAGLLISARGSVFRVRNSNLGDSELKVLRVSTCGIDPDVDAIGAVTTDATSVCHVPAP